MAIDSKDITTISKIVESAVKDYLDGMAKHEIEHTVHSYIDSKVRAMVEDAISKELRSQMRTYFFDVQITRKPDVPV